MTLAAPTLADEPGFPDDAVEVGRVIGAWGIKGGIRVMPFSKDPKALVSSKRWFVRPPEAPGPKTVLGAMPPLLRIVTSKTQGDDVVATAQELPDRNAAEGMKGARIFIARSSFPTAGDGEYYWIDLLGLNVVNREGVALGVVKDLLSTGPQTVLVIEAVEEEKTIERMVPFVAVYIDAVDLPGKRITVDWQPDY